MKEKLKGIRGILFDYGGTLDTPARHWSHVLWEGYQLAQVPVDKELFRQAYVAGERALERNPQIVSSDTFQDVLEKKLALQMDFLMQTGVLRCNYEAYARAVVDYCYAYAEGCIARNRTVLDILSAYYPMALVTNFYGNIEAVLGDFGLKSYFPKIIESARVGIRKPDPAIYRLGIEALAMQPGEVLVVGDSYQKDIVPAHSLGCRTVWLKGEAWQAEQPDMVVADFVLDSLTDLPTCLVLA